jgi:hypothetical protein
MVLARWPPPPRRARSAPSHRNPASNHAEEAGVQKKYRVDIRNRIRHFPEKRQSYGSKGNIFNTR